MKAAKKTATTSSSYASSRNPIPQSQPPTPLSTSNPSSEAIAISSDTEQGDVEGDVRMGEARGEGSGVGASLQAVRNDGDVDMGGREESHTYLAVQPILPSFIPANLLSQ